MNRAKKSRSVERLKFREETSKKGSLIIPSGMIDAAMQNMKTSRDRHK